MHLKAKTRVGYESIVRTHLMPAFGGRQVVRIDQPAVKACFADMAATGAAQGTIRSARQVLRLVMATAVDAKALASNPCDGVKLPRSAKSGMHFLTDDQVEDSPLRSPFPVGELEVTERHHTGGPNSRSTACLFDLRPARPTSRRARSAPSLSHRLAPPTGRGGRSGERGQWTARVRTHQDLPEPLSTASRFLCDELVPLLAGQGREDFVFPGPEGRPLRHGNFYARHFKPAVRQAGLTDTLRFHDFAIRLPAF